MVKQYMEIPLEYRDANGLMQKIIMRCTEEGMAMRNRPMSNIYVTAYLDTDNTLIKICKCELTEFVNIMYKNKGGVEI